MKWALNVEILVESPDTAEIIIHCPSYNTAGTDYIKGQCEGKIKLNQRSSLINASTFNPGPIGSPPKIATRQSFLKLEKSDPAVHMTCNRIENQMAVMINNLL